MFIPKLVFNYAMPFDRVYRQMYAKRELGPYPTREEVQAEVGAIRALWEEVNQDDKVMRLMVERTGVTLPRDLEVWIFGKGLNAMSSPLLIPVVRRDGAVYTREERIQTLIHEVLHRFLQRDENNQGISDHKNAIRTEYAAESEVTQNHITLYAFLEIILSELLGGDKVSEYIAPNNLDYKRALEIVKEKGAQALIERFRSFLK
jgi:hypothetical protein